MRVILYVSQLMYSGITDTLYIAICYYIIIIIICIIVYINIPMGPLSPSG